MQPPFFITINASGSKFFFHRDYINKYPNTFLYCLLSFNDRKYEHENYFNESDYEVNVDYEPSDFSHIHYYYTTGIFPEYYTKKIIEIFDFFSVILPDRRWMGVNTPSYHRYNTKKNKTDHDICFCTRRKLKEEKYCRKCTEKDDNLIKFCEERKRRAQ
ncbi:11570_t:CDS:2, partial [Dentiscutata erythropus]